MMSNRSVRITHLILFICLAILGIVEGVHTIWLMVQFGRYPDDPSSIFKGRLHALVVASIWTALLCPIFIALFLKAVAVANLINTTIFLGLTWVLWLVGAILITQYLCGGIDCTKTDYCHQLYHGLGFAWGTWLLTTITCVVVFICGDRAFRRGEGTPAAKA